jgi:hypothetical protein
MSKNNSVTKSKKTNRSKKKGNAFENQVAKELGIWMFNDVNFLQRHLTSGAQKNVYCGDIIPVKQLPDWFNKWTILIETKNGYPTNIPNIWRQTWLKDIFNKARQEAAIHNQNIIFLIIRFKNRSKLLFTNCYIDPKIILYNAIFPLEQNGKVHNIYVYDYNTLLKTDFRKVLKSIRK